MVVVTLIFLMLVAIVLKLAEALVLTPLSVIALAMADFPLLTDVFKELRSEVFALLDNLVSTSDSV